MAMSRRKALAALVGAGAAAACGRAAVDDVLSVLAAASLADALKAVSAAYAEAGGVGARFSFAASSTLARQIEAGAPGDIYASADEAWMDYLAGRGLILGETRRAPIGNALALIAPRALGGAPARIGPGLDLGAMLGAQGRLAVADPDHAPAGRYAKTALMTLVLWERAEPRLARAADVRGALAVVARGEAPLGIVYATDALLTEDVAVLGVFPAMSHPPIVYPFALLASARRPAADRLLDFIAGEAGLAIFARYGFTQR